MAMAARTTAVVSFAICFIFGVGCSWRGAVANGGGSLGGCVDNGSSCGVTPKLSNRFFGALAGARFFFGFRPRLLGIGKQLVRSADKVSASRQCRPTPPDGFLLICKIGGKRNRAISFPRPGAQLLQKCHARNWSSEPSVGS